MLRARNLSRTFPSGAKAFQDLSFDVEQGEVIGVVGTSGCGKSTLLRVIAGFDRGEGSITLHRQEITGLSPLVGLVFQEPRLMPWLSVRRNVEFGLATKRVPRAEQVRRVHHWLSAVGLSGFENHYPKECSGGMAQRAALARCLATQPEILLMDEPFSALDAFTRMQLQDVLLRILAESRTTLILVTHDVDEALYLCDRILVLRGQPGVLARQIDVRVPRPRPRADAELGRLKNQVLEILDLGVPPAPQPEYSL
jgi:sulfonate transport system ATP-binding protein